MTTRQERVPEPPRAAGLDSIKNRILALALVATLVPAVSTAVLSYRQNRRALTENLEGELRSRGAQAAREIDLWMKERAYDVRVFTGSFEVSENVERIPQGGTAGSAASARLADYLEGVHSRFSDYAELLVVDAAGRTVASSTEPAGSVDIVPEWVPRLERGETVLGEPYEIAGGTAATLAAPIVGADGRFLGSLAATLRFDAVAEVLRGAAPGPRGRVDLVASDGRLIASTAASGAGVDPAVLELLASTAGASAEYGTGGTEMVGISTTIPDLSWTLVTQLPTADAYAQVDRLRDSAFLLVSVLLVVVGSLAYLLGSVIVRPLVRLTAGARAVAAGDLSVDLPVGGRGEVGDLTQVFNEMVRRLRTTMQDLDVRNRELERLAVTDLLTGLHNRRYLLEAFDREIRRADRHERPFCVLMIDVDAFKQYNDTYGHAAGDAVLQGMGRVITDAIRDLDVAARYGGEEFLVLLPECELSNAVLAGERIRTRLSRESFDGRKVTISVGAAEFPTHGEGAAAVIAAADEALYEAKRLGRDQVIGAPPKSAAEKERRASDRAAAAKKKRTTTVGS